MKITITVRTGNDKKQDQRGGYTKRRPLPKSGSAQDFGAVLRKFLEK